MTHKPLTLRIVGFVLSLLFTFTAYLLITHLATRTLIPLLLVLASLQAMAQFICFLNIWDEKGPPWNLIVFVSTVSIVLIIIFFSIWIMNHLNYNMMP